MIESRPSGLRSAAAWLLLALAIALVYGNSLANGFHLDDSYGLVGNAWVRDLGNIPRYFSDPFTLTSYPNNADWRPLLQVSYALSYALSRSIRGDGYDPLCWRLMQLGLHLCACMGLYALGRALLGRGRLAAFHGLSERAGEWVALLGALLFAVHPIASGAANYMWARSSLLVAALALPASALYLRGIAAAGRRWPWQSIAALGLYVLALLTKAEALSLLLVFALVEQLYTPGGLRSPASWLRLLPALLLSAVYLALRFQILPEWLRAYHQESTVDSYGYLLTQVRVWWYYLGQILAPLWLVADWGGAYPVSRGADDARVWLAVGGWLIVLALLWSLRKRAPAASLLGGAWLLHLLPHSSLIPLAEMANEHRPYLAAGGLIVLLAAGVWLVLARLPLLARCLAALALALAGLGYGELTRQRNLIWRDGASMWADTLTKVPSSSRAQMNYGLELMKQGRLAEAEARFREAVRLSPTYLFAHINLGLVLTKQGSREAGWIELDRSVELGDAQQPANALPHLWRGKVRRDQNDLTGALSDFQRAAELDANDADALAGVAECLSAQGRFGEAEPWLARGEAIDAPRFSRLREQLSGR